MIDIENVHLIVANHTCDVCAKSFKTKETLKQHRYNHEDFKRFPCLLCQKRFSRAENLNTHKLEHTGEKPHQ